MSSDGTTSEAQLAGQLPVTAAPRHEVTAKRRGAAAVCTILAVSTRLLVSPLWFVIQVRSSRLEMEWRQQSSVSCAHAFTEAQRWIEVSVSPSQLFPAG